MNTQNPTPLNVKSIRPIQDLRRNIRSVTQDVKYRAKKVPFPTDKTVGKSTIIEDTFKGGFFAGILAVPRLGK
jgi:hypothetical protein